MANITITQLPAAGSITGAELVPIVQDGQTVRTTASALAGSPVLTQTFITKNQESSLINSRYLTAGTGIGLSDGGAAYQIRLNGVSATLESMSSGVAVNVSGTMTARTISATGDGISVTNGNGQSGNPTVALTGIAASLASHGGTGFLALPGNGTVTARTLTGTTNQINITNPNGIADNPTISIADNPVLSGTASVKIPSGSTAQRPVGTNGMLRYNSDTGVFEGFLAGNWSALSTGSNYVGGTNINITGLTISLTGVVGVSNGGTSFGSYTSGDVIYANSSSSLAKLGIGSSGYVFTSSGSAPQWTDPDTLTVGNALTADNATNADHADNATNATNAVNVGTTLTNTNANFYVPFVAAASTDNQAIGVDAGFTYNPSTNAITSGISGGTF